MFMVKMKLIPERPNPKPICYFPKIAGPQYIPHYYSPYYKDHPKKNPLLWEAPICGSTNETPFVSAKLPLHAKRLRSSGLRV